MPNLREVVQKVRSKNAGPFWITIDIFCGSDRAFDQVRNTLASRDVARLFDTPLQTLKRFDIANLHVIKFSFPRPHVQGTAADRDLHGASFAALLADLPLAPAGSEAQG